MGSIGQVSCGKTVGKWPRKANTQTRHGQRAFPCYFSDFYGENDARISIRSLSPSGFRSIWKKGEGKKERKKNLNETRNIFCTQYSSRFFVIDAPWFLGINEISLSKNLSELSRFWWTEPFSRRKEEVKENPLEFHFMIPSMEVERKKTQY